MGVNTDTGLKQIGHGGGVVWIRPAQVATSTIETSRSTKMLKKSWLDYKLAVYLQSPPYAGLATTNT
jgi:hypothetical protein